MAETSRLESVASTISPELRRKLTEKREAADRSEAAEIRQAIRWWVELEAAPAPAPVPATSGEAA